MTLMHSFIAPAVVLLHNCIAIAAALMHNYILSHRGNLLPFRFTGSRAPTNDNNNNITY